MMKKKPLVFSNHSVVISWMISYFILLLIPFLLSLFVYTQSARIIENELSQGHMSALEQTKLMLDQRLKDIEKLSVEICVNTRIYNLASYTGELQFKHVYAMTEIMKDLKTYKVANHFINDFYIYFKNHDYILTYEGKYSPDRFYSINGISQDYSEWKQMLEKKHYKEYIPVQNSTDGLIKEIDFVQSLPIVSIGDSLATLVVQIDQDLLQKFLREANWMPGGQIFITGKDNHLVTLSDNTESSLSLDIQFPEQKSGILYDVINEEEVIVSYINSDVNDWRIVSVVPMNTYLEKVKYVQNIVFVSGCLCFAAGVLIIMYFTKKNYSPLKRIMTVFQEFIIQDTKNEYHFIEKSIKKIINDKNKLNSFVTRQNKILRNNFIAQLLKGELDDSISVTDACKNYRIELSDKGFCVILFHIEKIGDTWYADNDDRQETERLVNLVISNITEEMIEKYHKGYMTIIDKRPLCLLNFSRPYKDSIKYELKEVIEDIMTFIETKFDIKFSVSVSRYHETIHDVENAYREAVEAVKYREIVGGDRIIHYEDLWQRSMQNNESISLFSEEQKFINLFKAENYAAAREVINNIFSSNLFQKQPSLQMAQCRMFGLINTIINLLQDININGGEEFLRESKPVEKLLKCTSIQTLQHEINNILLELEKYISHLKNNENDAFINKVINFIEQNYRDINLSVSMLASEFSVHPSYLTRLFKKKIGYSVLEYIHMVRTEKAKNLMQKKDLSIKEIAEETGFVESRAFIRVFKKYEGITPGAFKEILSNTPKTSTSVSRG